jgi:hypothetical protein
MVVHIPIRTFWATAFLHALEHGTKEPCLNTLDILAKRFDLSISEFMKGILRIRRGTPREQLLMFCECLGVQSEARIRNSLAASVRIS